MIIANQKKKENIAEYILYMWQIEDLVRAFKLDKNLIKTDLVDRYKQPQKVKHEIQHWYENIIELMINEKIEKSGHLQHLKNIVFDLYDLHLAILNSQVFEKYAQLYEKARPLILEFREKLKSDTNNEIEICLTGLQSYLLLKIQNKAISKETTEAFEIFTQLIKELAILYHKREKDELDI